MEAVFNFMTSLSHHWVTVAANGIWIGALLTAIAWIMRRYARTVNAATGYIVWWSVLALVIASPFLGTGLSALTARLEAIRLASATSAVPLAAAEQTAATESQPIDVVLSEISLDAPAEQSASCTATLTMIPREQTAGVAGSTDSDSSFLSFLTRLLPLSLFALWICIAGALLFRIWLAYRRMVAIKRRSLPFDPLRYPRVDGLLRRAALRRKTELHLTDEVGSPVAAGLGRPIILIPRSMMRQLTQHELEAVVVHELAHILRWDDWSKLAQKLIEALFFFNPAVRWIGRQLELEREVACDDRVVAQTGEPTEYARCLTRLTELATIPNASLIPGVLTGRKQIFHRFDQLLSGRRRTEIRFCRSRFACAMAVVLLVTVVAVRVVPVLAFPAEAISYDEFSQTVGCWAHSILTSEDESNQPTDCQDVCDGMERLTAESMRFTPGLAESADVIYASAEPCATSQPSSYFAALVPEAEKTSDDRRTDERSERVVDWDDKIFDLPVTGTIHGTEKQGGSIEVWINEEQTVRAAIKGNVRFTSDLQQVRSISRDGYFAIKEEHGSVRRELDVCRGSHGEVVYNYFIDGEPKEYGKDGRRLLARVIREMAPQTGVSVVPVPDGSDLVITGPDVDVAVAPVPTATASGVTVAPTAQPELFVIADADAPAPRIGRQGFISRVIDWAANPFNMDGKGLMVSSDDDGETSILWSDGRNKIKVKMNGEIQFTDDDRGIESISRHGYFAMWERRNSKTRELTVEPDRSGDLEYGYYEDGKNRPFDENAQEWLSDILIDVIRETGVGAKERAQRILDKKGVDGVLEEIESIESNYVKRIYFNAVLDNDKLGQAEYAQILELVGREIDSDYEKAEILIDMADRVSEHSALIHDYVSVVATMDSDYETRRALAAVALDRNADPEVVDAVLEIASGMDSDYEKAELLISMAPYCNARGTLQTSYVDAVVGIDSDYEARRVLSALSLKGDVDPDMVYSVMQIVGQFDSDYETAELLSDMAPYIGNNDRAQDAYLEAVGNIDSDYDTRRTLTTFIEASDMTDARVLAILPIVETMSSSYEQSEILKGLAKYCRGNDELEDAFIDVVETLDSDYEIEKLYTYLYRRDRGSRESSR